MWNSSGAVSDTSERKAPVVAMIVTTTTRAPNQGKEGAAPLREMKGCERRVVVGIYEQGNTFV